MTRTLGVPRGNVFFPEIRRRISLMGMPVDCLTEEQAIRRILQALQRGRGGWVITPNLDQLRQYWNRPELRGMYAQADLVLADGMPLVWASRILGHRLPQRVPGSGLIHSLTAAAGRAGMSVFMLGGNPGAAEAAAGQLCRRNPGLVIAGIFCPPLGFENDEAQMARIRAALRHARPQIVYVGLGFPKQERLIAGLRGEVPGAWFLGIGISFSFVSGEVVRAPGWMQRSGLEWVHRLVQEPRRLFGRYVLHDIPFAVQLFMYMMIARWRGQQEQPEWAEQI